MTEDHRGDLVAGSQLGAYRIEGLLGVGGMGEVYRARDTRLHRIVALKVLPAASFADPESKRRFLQEAQAASALNHPNIVTLHDIASDGDTDFLVLEYVPGNPLGRMIPPGGLPLSDVLRYGTQIAGALAVAHAAGIVHRDIKPANVMITPDSQVKVLDFGVAKLMERVASPDTETRSAVARTMSGVVVGTHSYMSPEQARGDAVDGRSDLFSLGLVLYQMATGRLPIPGASLGQVLLEGTTTRLEPPSRLRRAIPRVLDDVILRLLQFDPAERFQTAAELRDALIGLAAPPRPLSPRILALAVAMGVLSLVVSGLWFVGRQRGFTTAEALQYIRLTDFPDAVHSPTLSPDGKMLAFVRGAEPFLFGPGELYVKVLPDGQPVALTHDGTQKMGPAFTPDGSRILFTSTGWSSLSVPVAGGTPALFMPNAAGLRWIAPGQVMFSEMRNAPNMAVVAASESRGQARDVYVPASPQGMAHFSERSPDGLWVLIVEMDTNAWQPCRVVSFDGSSTGRQVGPPGSGCTSAAWSPDGRWMYFTATLNSESHLWRQRFPDGSPEQLTSGMNQERGVVVDPDGRSVITSLGANQSAVWFHGDTGDRPISVEGYSYRPVMSPDGSKVFYLVRRAARRSFSIGELWATDLEAGRNDRVLPEFLIRAFHVSPDGRFVVFDAFDEMDRSRIWIAPTDRSQAPRRLTPEGTVEEQRPFFGASGDIFFMQEQSADRRFLYRMKPDGSDRRKLSEPIDFLVNIAPDENWAVVWGPLGTRLLPVAGGASRGLCTCDAGPIFPDSPRVSWSGDGRTVFISLGSNQGTVLIPWRGADTVPAGPLLAPADLRKLPGARYLQESSVVPGPMPGTYAFARQAEQSNLYRIRVP